MLNHSLRHHIKQKTEEIVDFLGFFAFFTPPVRSDLLDRIFERNRD